MKWDLLKKFLVFSSEHTGKYKTSLFFESLRDVYKYNISILEYFQFGFYSMSESEKKKWAGTGTMYEFQKTSNPVNERKILDDKRLFYQNYKEFFIHELYTLEELENNESLVKNLLSSNKKLVVKESSGKAGVGVEIIETKELKGSDVISIMKKNGFGILETYINQHSSIHQLSPSGVNTIRIFTQIRKDGTYEVLGCRMRISVDSPVDNMAAGNLAAPLDEITGIINGPGVYSDITKAPESIHPITRVSIIGFQIPFWK
jgi:hypothetical protein